MRSTARYVTVRYDSGRPVLKPYRHQQEAIKRFSHSEDIALFFEMGCGKSFTLLQIAEAKYRAGEIDSLLVVAPNDVHRQWYDELVSGVDRSHDGVMWQELAVDFGAQCVGGRGGQHELVPFDDDGLFHFVSVNVDTFSTPHKWEPIVEWANTGRTMVAIDEATSIKNPSSKRSQRLLYEFNDVRRRGKAVLSSSKKCRCRAVLTGTPVTNGPMDLWAIMEFVHPNYFNRNYYSFRAYYGMFTKLTVAAGGGARTIDVLLNEKTWKAIHSCRDYAEAAALFGCSEDTYMTVMHQQKFIGPYKHADELRRLLEPAAVFCRLTDCADMPRQQYIERRVEMSPEQASAYRSMKEQMLAQYKGYEMAARSKLVISVRLQQISSGFIFGHHSVDDGAYARLLDDPEADVMPDEVVWLGESNPKLDALMRDVAECAKPLIIMTRFSAEAARIYGLCCGAGYSVALFTGWKVTNGGVDAFKRGDVDIIVANSAKIARGFNLQVSHTTLFYSNSFSMEVRQQAEFRTFRLGQKKPCLYIDYSASEIDRTVNQSLAMKKSLLDYIREKNIEEVV